MKLSNADRVRISWLVESHMILDDPVKLREAKLKRILTMPGIDELLALHRADALATDGDASHIDYCEWYLREQPGGPINPPPLVTGHDLVQRGWTPGPEFASLLEKVREAQLERQVNTKKEAAAEWVEQFRVERLAFPLHRGPRVPCLRTRKHVLRPRRGAKTCLRVRKHGTQSVRIRRTVIRP